MNKYVKYFNVLMIIILAVSCSNSDTEEPMPIDKEDPTMVVSRPTDGEDIPKGTYVILDGIFEDDIALKELKISLSAPAEMKSSKGIVDPWLPEDFTIALEGKRQTIEAYKLFNEAVPVDCMSGKYTLLFELFDEEGKVMLQTIDIDIF